jgi:hypothetical protein
MRSLIATIPLLLIVGCATQPNLPPYVYTPPVVVSLTSLYRTNNFFVAVFTFTNISSNSMSYCGDDKGHPDFCFQYMGREPSFSNEDALNPSFQLSPGQSGTFFVRRKQFTGPFRAGIEMSGEFDPKIVPSQDYWSAYITP